MAVKFLTEKCNTRRPKHPKYYNLILMILFAGVVALVLFFAHKGEKRPSGEKKADFETINIRLDDLGDKSY